MKFIKWFFGGAVVIVLALVLYITFMFDVNALKPEIVDAVKQQTGRDLVISQDLRWTFFPFLGVDLGEIQVSNPAGFEPAAMIEVKQALASVALMPLFSKRVQIEKLALEGLVLNLVTQKNGASSFDGLVSDSKDVSLPQDDNKATDTLALGHLSALSIDGISITASSINIIDRVKGTEHSIGINHVSLGAFSLGKATDFSFDVALVSQMNVSSKGKGKVLVSSDGNSLSINSLTLNTLVSGQDLSESIEALVVADVDLDLKKKSLQVALKKLTAMDINATGHLAVNYGKTIPKIALSLGFEDINLDPFLSQVEPEAKADTTAEVAATEPDLSALKGLDLTLDVKVKSIQAAKLKTDNWQLQLAIKNGIVAVTQLSADLYQGKMMFKGQLDGNKAVARYQFEQQLSAVQIRPLLMDAAEVDVLAGTANFSMTGKGKGLLPETLKQQLLAQGDFSVNDGALYGVNIPQMLRSAQAKLNGDFAATDTEERKTDFSSLTGSFSTQSGVVTNPDLALAAPLLRLEGTGTVDMLSQNLDYKLMTRVVGSLSGQEAQTEQLQGLNIPLKVTGTVQEPKFGLDTSELLDEKLKQETEKVKEKVKDKLKDSLLKRLGGL